MIEAKGQVALAKEHQTAAGRKQRISRMTQSDPAKSALTEASNDVGAALRYAFKATVDEDIPAEMLDLLRQLD